MIDYIDSIASSPLFKGVKKQELGPVLECLCGYVKNFIRGEYISFADEAIKYIGIILDGTVHMMKEDEWGNKTLFALIMQGQIFGETFTCGSDALSAVTFYASTDTRILFLPFERVMRTCTISCIFHHRLIENMVQLIADKNRILMEKIEVISKKTLREKIITYLYLQARQHKNNKFEIPMGRGELANYLCADRSALTRQLSLMKTEGLLGYEKNFFHLIKIKFD